MQVVVVVVELRQSSFPSWQDPNREFADDASLEFTYVI
jgi:hypothetical protein